MAKVPIEFYHESARLDCPRHPRKIDEKRRPSCSKCGKPARHDFVTFAKKTRDGQVFEKTELRFWCCDLWAWGYKRLVDKETHDARKAAHAAFDQIWHGLQLTSRADAYVRLAKKLGLTREECHMSVMDAATARQVVPASYEIIRDLAGQSDPTARRAHVGNRHALGPMAYQTDGER